MRAADLPSDAPPNTHTITTNLDETTYVLHTRIIDNLIKNSKTFEGGKDYVKQRLEDLEHLFDTVQIPDSHQLDLVPYYLRGETLHWYKNNMLTLMPWQIFIQELRKKHLSHHCMKN
jgi:hypothetical protein